MKPPRLNVTIDRHDAVAVTASLKAELARALGEPAAQSAALHPRVTPVLRLGRLPLDPGRAGGRRFGAAVARAIAKGVVR